MLWFHNRQRFGAPIIPLGLRLQRMERNLTFEAYAPQRRCNVKSD
jgi:hypothetical protein